MHAFISNTGWLLFDKVIRLLLGLLVGAWVARYLGPAQFGTLAYVLAFIALFQAAANLGADRIAVRDLVIEPDQSAATLGTLLVLRLIAGILSWMAALTIMAIMNPGDHQLLALTAVIGALLIFQAADTVDLWFQSKMQSRRTVLAKLAAYIFANAVKVALILNEAGIMAFAIVAALEFALAAIGLSVAYRRLPTKEKWSFRKLHAIALVKQSWPFMLSGLSVLIYMRIDQIFLKELRSEAELGIYAAALPISQLWHAVPMTLSTSLSPYIARKKKESQKEYESALLIVFRLFGAVSIIISIVVAVSSCWIISVLYGDEFSKAAGILSIHVFSNIFIALGIAQSLWLVNEGAGKISLLKTLMGAVVAVVGNIIAIPIYGVTGAAVVSLLSFAVAGVLSNILLAPQIFLLQLGVKRKMY